MADATSAIAWAAAGIERIYSKDKVTETVGECFSTDSELISRYHLHSGEGLDCCVADTVDAILNKSTGMQFYSLINNGEMIGYFGKEDDGKTQSLTSFFIKPKHRNEAVKSLFWESVNSVMGEKYLCGLYDKNIRAIRFIEKQNAEPKIKGIQNGEPFTFYVINNTSCR